MENIGPEQYNTMERQNMNVDDNLNNFDSRIRETIAL